MKGQGRDMYLISFFLGMAVMFILVMLYALLGSAGMESRRREFEEAQLASGHTSHHMSGQVQYHTTGHDPDHAGKKIKNSDDTDN